MLEKIRVNQGKWSMLVMVEYTFTFKMMNKTKNSGSKRVAGLTLP